MGCEQATTEWHRNIHLDTDLIIDGQVSTTDSYGTVGATSMESASFD